MNHYVRVKLFKGLKEKLLLFGYVNFSELYYFALELFPFFYSFMYCFDGSDAGVPVLLIN